MKRGHIMIPKKYITGEYAVGTCTLSLTDESRTDDLGKGGARRIAVRLYYPVKRESIAGAEKARALSETKAKAVAKSCLARRLPEDVIYPEHYYVPMMDEIFTLILFNHGFNSYVEANTFLCCDIASHGYIIASVGHANEAIENDYDNGEYDLFDKSIGKRLYDKNVISVLIEQSKVKKYKTARGMLDAFNKFQDSCCSFFKLRRLTEWVKDSVYAVNAVKERFSEHIDLSYGIGTGGHSFGGCTADRKSVV